MIENVTFNGVPDCARLSNGTVELVVATGFGPRILAYAFDGGDNVLGWHSEAKVETPLGTWRPYGGHRLWLAPENMPLSYAPDNGPVDVDQDGELTVRLKGSVDASGVQKEMSITLSETGSAVTIDHRLTVSEACVAAAWALTIMHPGGIAVIPNEPSEPYGPSTLLPARSMAVWPYTDLTDPRWSFEKYVIGLRVDESMPDPQKIGVLNKQAWAAYELNDLVFTKRSEFIDAETYPDMNSNFEVYTAGGFVEIETLSPLRELAPGQAIEHREIWSLEMLS